MADITRYTPSRELPIRIAQGYDLNEKKLAAAVLNAGMITMVDPADIPDGALQLAFNAICRYDRTSRRPGSVLMTPEKPDTNAVLKLATLRISDGSSYTLRFTPSSIYRLTNIPTWTAVTGTLAGTVADRIQTAIVIDSGAVSRLVFANNGADPIQLVDLSGDTFGDLSDYVHPAAVPKYRFVTGFFNRVVGAANRGINEIEVAWSGDGNPTEWDPSLDETAGNSIIMDNPSDLSDFIMGIYGFTNVMVVLREKSVWLATKQAVPTQPFYFYSVIPGIGCDSPHSVVNIGDGIAWVDRRTKGIYIYTVGGELEHIEQNIQKTILNSVDDPAQIFAGYNPRYQEYTVFFPSVGSKTVTSWTYNRHTKAWTKNEYYDVVSVEDVDFATAATTIDDLVGPIEGLTGTIDDLSPTSGIMTTRMYGRNDGTIAIEDPNQPMDAPHTDKPNGITYETQLVSKAFEAETENVDILVSRISIEYICQIGGTFSLYYSRDGGYTWALAKTVKPTTIGTPKLITFTKCIRARRMSWKLMFTDGLFDVLAYVVNVYPSGVSSNQAGR